MNHERCKFFMPESFGCRLSTAGSFTCYFSFGEAKKKDAEINCDAFKRLSA